MGGGGNWTFHPLQQLGVSNAPKTLIFHETKVISALRHKSKFEFRTFLFFFFKFLGFNVVVLVKTFPLMYQLLM